LRLTGAHRRDCRRLCRRLCVITARVESARLRLDEAQALPTVQS
jgi:hypothetical protein